MKFILVFLSLILFSSLSLAETVYVMPVKGKSVSDTDRETIEELVKSGVEQTEGYEVTEDKSSSDFQLKTKVMKLGGAYIIKVYKRKGKQKLHTAKIKATDIEEMDTVAGRAVRAALMETSISDSARVTEVTKEEEEGTRRYQSKKQWWIGFGLAKSSNLNADGAEMQYGGGYNWDLDPDFDLQLAFDIFSASDASDANFMTLMLGVNRFFSRDKHAFFAGGEIGYGAASASDGDDNSLIFSNLTSDDDASGWVVGAMGGMKFFRTSSVNLGIVLRYNYMFEKTDISDKSPSVTSLRLVGYF